MDSLRIYDKPELYDLQNEEDRADRAFFLERAKETGGPVLELACGTGILSLPLARAGFEVDGIDLSPAMLARARTKAAGLAGIRFLEGDMRSFSTDRTYRLVFLGFNSVAHLHEASDLEAMLARVAAALETGGRFIIDCFIPNPRFFMHDPEQRRGVFEGGGLTITERNLYDPLAQVNHIEWSFSHRGESWTERLDMRMYYPRELKALIEHSGFRIVESWGDHEGSALLPGSPFQIHACEFIPGSLRR